MKIPWQGVRGRRTEPRVQVTPFPGLTLGFLGGGESRRGMALDTVVHGRRLERLAPPELEWTPLSGHVQKVGVGGWAGAGYVATTPMEAWTRATGGRRESQEGCGQISGIVRVVGRGRVKRG